MSRLPASRAFTLIELLIVVAIIGILASISIVNFLEAQTRAKVADVAESQRQLELALELYRVDNNHYPPGPNPFVRTGEIVETWRLSTPVAFLVRIPEDIFHSPQGFGEIGGPFGPGGVYMKYVNDPIVNEWWLLWSYGPDQDMEFLELKYDPTNGTISDGDIYSVGSQR
jgi:prepilin-type N-terminal cleavage/methylation domain-containing protein